MVHELRLTGSIGKKKPELSVITLRTKICYYLNQEVAPKGKLQQVDKWLQKTATKVIFIWPMNC